MRKCLSSSTFVALLSLLSIFVSSQTAQADQCLSQFPDIAWEMGIPSNLPTGPNLLLTAMSASYTNTLGKKIIAAWGYSPTNSIHSGDFNFSDYLYGQNEVSLNNHVTEKTVIKYTYTYSGVGCSERSIERNGFFTLTRIDPIENSDARYRSALESMVNQDAVQKIYSSLNFIQQKFLGQGLKSFIDEITQTQTHPLNPGQKGMYPQKVVWPKSPDVPKYSNGFDATNYIEPYLLLYGVYARQGIDIRNGLFKSQPLGIFLDGCAVGNQSGTMSAWNPSPIFREGFFLYFMKQQPTCKMSVVMPTPDGIWVHVGDEYVENPNFVAKSSSGPSSASSASASKVSTQQNSIQKQVSSKILPAIKILSWSCIKGNLFLKFTGKIKGCPKGYKIKKLS